MCSGFLLQMNKLLRQCHDAFAQFLTRLQAACPWPSHLKARCYETLSLLLLDFAAAATAALPALTSAVPAAAPAAGKSDAKLETKAETKGESKGDSKAAAGSTFISAAGESLLVSGVGSGSASAKDSVPASASVTASGAAAVPSHLAWLEGLGFGWLREFVLEAKERLSVERVRRLLATSCPPVALSAPFD
jgi:hypothetical protein